MQELTQTTVKKVIEDINKGIKVHPKVLGALCSLRSCTIVEENYHFPLEYCFTLTEWRNFKEEVCSDEEFLQIFPHLTSYVE